MFNSLMNTKALSGNVNMAFPDAVYLNRAEGSSVLSDNVNTSGERKVLPTVFLNEGKDSHVASNGLYTKDGGAE